MPAGTSAPSGTVTPPDTTVIPVLALLVRPTTLPSPTVASESIML